MDINGLMNSSLSEVRVVRWWSPNSPASAERIEVQTMLGRAGVLEITYSVASRNSSDAGISEVRENAPRYPPDLVSAATFSNTWAWRRHEMSRYQSQARSGI